MKLRPRKTASQNASRLLPRLAERVFVAGDKSLADDLNAEDAHSFRILVKRSRYTLEYFRPCYGEGMDACLGKLKGLQQALGELNDCYATKRLLLDILKAGDPPQRYQKLFAALNRREEDLMERFRAEWRHGWEDPAARRKFLRYLAKPRASPQPPEAK